MGQNVTKLRIFLAIDAIFRPEVPYPAIKSDFSLFATVQKAGRGKRLGGGPDQDTGLRRPGRGSRSIDEAVTDVQLLFACLDDADRRPEVLVLGKVFCKKIG